MVAGLQMVFAPCAEDVRHIANLDVLPKMQNPKKGHYQSIFRMRLMRFDFTISHVAGKDLITADTLSRSPLQVSPLPDLSADADLYVKQIIYHLPATECRLEEISNLRMKIRSVSW